MTMRRKCNAAMAAVAAVIFGLGAWGGAPDDARAAKDTLVIAIPGLPQGVDLDRHIGPQTWTMGAQLFALGMEWEYGPYPYSTGAYFDPDKIPGFAYPIGYTNRNMQPGIMNACDTSEDGKTVTYHIRPGVVSVWGNEFTADDVMWRIERERAVPVIYALISRLFNMHEASYEKIDKYTVKITNETAMPLACPGLTNFYQTWHDSTEVMKHATEEDPLASGWTATNGGGFGAYRVTAWEAGKRVVMEANPNFWRGEPKIKRIIYLAVPESTGRLALLKAGKVDMAEGLSPDEVMSLQGEDAAQGVAVRGNRQMWLILNNLTKPFDDVRVRQAINYAMPREDIVNSVYRGMGAPWHGVISSVTPGYENLKLHTFDLEKARQLISDAGYGDGFEADLAYSAGEPEMENLAIILQTSMAKIGGKLELKRLPVAAHSDLVQTRKAQMAFWIDSPIQPDVNYVVNLVYTSGPLSLVNYSNFEDPMVDELIETGAGIVDAEQRLEHHKGVQQRIQEQSAFGWTVEPYFRIGLSSNLKGWRWYTAQYYKLHEVEFVE